MVLLSLLALAAQARPRGVALPSVRLPSLSTGATSPAHCVDAGGNPARCEFRYFGGPVLSNVKVHAVLWGSGVDAETVARIPAFLTTVTNEDWMDWLAEYDTDLTVQAGGLAGLSGTGQVIGRGTFAGVRQITPATSGPDLRDADVATELRRQVAAGALPPPDPDTVYALFFPRGVSIASASGERTCQQLCGFHGTASSDTGRSLRYLVIPDHRAPDSVHGGGCDFGCGTLDPFGNLSVTTSHELGEAITNPEMGGAPVGDAPLAWYDEVNFEIGDVCSATSSIAAPDGGTFAVQQLYSRRSGLCQSTRQLGADELEFKIWLPTNRATVTTGGTLDVHVTTAVVHGGPQPLTLDVTSLPAGVTARWPRTVTAGDGFDLHLSVTPDAGVVADSVVRVVATGSSSHSASLLLEVARPPPGGCTAAPGPTLPPLAALSWLLLRQLSVRRRRRPRGS